MATGQLGRRHADQALRRASREYDPTLGVQLDQQIRGGKGKGNETIAIRADFRHCAQGPSLIADERQERPLLAQAPSPRLWGEATAPSGTLGAGSTVDHRKWETGEKKQATGGCRASGAAGGHTA
ncbi:MAG TPA: hypothetical protein VKQ29_01540 [Aliidongia sp.]|nr:hypothetical protein [Aliidongia sp.]